MSRRSGNYGDPYFLKPRFKSVCPETGKTIEKGDECAYFPKARRAYHESSKAAEGVRELLVAKADCMMDANW